MRLLSGPWRAKDAKYTERGSALKPPACPRAYLAGPWPAGTALRARRSACGCGEQHSRLMGALWWCIAWKAQYGDSPARRATVRMERDAESAPAASADPAQAGGRVGVRYQP